MRERTAELLRSALFESAFVVLGVILALAANEWRESRMHRREAEAAVTSIVEELRANRDAVASSMAYHRSRLDTLEAHRGDGWVPSLQLFSRGFIAPAQLDQTAWTSASETGTLTHIPYAEVLRLSRVYAQQARYADQARIVGEIVYRELYAGGAESVLRNRRNLGGIIGTFWYREGQLVSTYDSVLAALGSSATTNGDSHRD